MPTQRPNEPIAPTTIPGQPLDPKIPPDQQADDDDLDEQDEDDQVGTDEHGHETLRAHPLAAAPDVSSDRLADARSARLDGTREPPLAIREIENLEDDAKGG